MHRPPSPPHRPCPIDGSPSTKKCDIGPDGSKLYAKRFYSCPKDLTPHLRTAQTRFFKKKRLPRAPCPPHRPCPIDRSPSIIIYKISSCQTRHRQEQEPCPPPPPAPLNLFRQIEELCTKQKVKGYTSSSCTL